MNAADVRTPRRIMGLYDQPMWESVDARQMRLQRCTRCGTFQYPPGPGCHACLSMDLEWIPIGGGATILSWVIFHRQYLPAYPAPYNSIAVRLDEGPIMISNLEGEKPSGTWIGERVRLVYATMPDGVILPKFELDRPRA